MIHDWTRTILGPGLTVADWRALCDQLDSATPDEQWERAFRAIERRFARKFVEPADALLEIDAQEDALFSGGRGFAVLTLDSSSWRCCTAAFSAQQVASRPLGDH